MNKGSTLFLKLVLALVAGTVLLGMFWFPQTEGRAANLDLISIYKDPFIIYMYFASTPFFMAFYQAFKLLGYIEQNKVFSPIAVKALRNIKYSAISFIGFLVVAIFFIRFMGGGGDSAGPTMIGLVLIFASSVIATAAAVFQKLLQNAVDLKSENDLTV